MNLMSENLKSLDDEELYGAKEHMKHGSWRGIATLNSSTG